MRGKIDGEAIAEMIKQELQDYNGVPEARIVLVGDDPASETFVHEKQQMAEKIGFEIEVDRYPPETVQDEIIEDVDRLSHDESIDGILVQLPLPEHIDEEKVFEAIPPGKDIDGLTPRNLGKLMRGEADLRPAAVEAVLEILKGENIELKGSDVTVINDSELIGRPLSMALTERDATVTMCHDRTQNLAEKTQGSDILVTATGQHGLITPEMVKEGAIVIDAGYEHGEGDIEGADEIAEKALIAEVPGGIGPVTVACTMENLRKLHENRS